MSIYADLGLAQEALKRNFGEVEFSLRTSLLPSDGSEDEDEEEEEFFSLPMPPEPAKPGENPDLYSLKAFLTNCQACGLCENRTKVVFGIGNESPDLVVLGEAPGANEDKQGEPFIGKSGRKLNAMLENVLELKREEVYILNAVKCRPPRNRDPSEQEIYQ